MDGRHGHVPLLSVYFDDLTLSGHCSCHWSLKEGIVSLTDWVSQESFHQKFSRIFRVRAKQGELGRSASKVLIKALLDHWSSDNSCDGVHYVGALSISFPVWRHSSAINTKKKVAQRCSPIAMQATRRTHRNFKCEVCKPCWTEKNVSSNYSR